MNPSTQPSAASVLPTPAPLPILRFFAPGEITVQTPDGYFDSVATMNSADEKHRELGRLIVTACNAHQSLVDALAGLLDEVDNGALLGADSESIIAARVALLSVNR